MEGKGEEVRRGTEIMGLRKSEEKRREGGRGSREGGQGVER